MQSTSCDAVDLYTGDFHVVYEDGSEYHLRGIDSKDVSKWVDCIAERIEWSHSSAGMRINEASSKKGSNSNKDESDDDDNGKRRKRQSSSSKNSKNNNKDEDDDIPTSKNNKNKSNKNSRSKSRDDDDDNDSASIASNRKGNNNRRGDDDSEEETPKNNKKNMGKSKNSKKNMSDDDENNSEEDDRRSSNKKKPSNNNGGGLLGSSSQVSDDEDDIPKPTNRRGADVFSVRLPPGGLAAIKQQQKKDSEDEDNNSSDDATVKKKNKKKNDKKNNDTKNNKSKKDETDDSEVETKNTKGKGKTPIPETKGKNTGTLKRDESNNDEDSDDNDRKNSKNKSNNNNSKNSKKPHISETDSDTENHGRSSKNNKNGKKNTGLGGGRNRDRSSSAERAPPGPEFSGWVKKKARTKMGSWQMRFMRLQEGIIYFADDDITTDYSATIDVTAITEVKSAGSLRNAAATDKKILLISTTFETDMQLRCSDEKAVSQWVSIIEEAIKHRKKYGHSQNKSKKDRNSNKHGSDTENDSNSDNSDDEDGSKDGDDSDKDSDADSNAGGSDEDRLPPPPPWFRDFSKVDESKWMNATQKMLNRLFDGIYDNEVDADGNATGEKKVVISKLSDAATKACAELEDRVMECRMRSRPDIIKHHIQFFDLKFLQELTLLTTGTGPSSLTSKQILQLIDCIEGFTSVRKRALGGITLSAQEAKPGLLLRETRRSLITRYMEVMGPKLHDVALKVLNKLRAGKGEMVHRTISTRVGTSSPTDLFNLMSEHLKIAREGGSTTLQRRLLSSVMAEVVYYAREVLTELMDWWNRAPTEVDMDYVTAVINDSGLMLDHIEQLEAYFAEALKKETDNINANASNEYDDEMDKQEAEQAAEDLAAIEQDIPRAKGQLLSSGSQLTGVLVDIITSDFREPLSQLFTSAWEKNGNHVTVITVTATDYLTESIMLLDPYFFDRLASMVLAHLTEAYLMRLLAPENVRKLTSKDKREKEYKGGFSSKYKLTEDRLKKLVADVVEMGNCFSQFMPREDLTRIMASINSVREMLTIDSDNMLTVFEAALRNDISISTHIFLTFEKCVQLREDLSKQDRKSLMEEATKILRDIGEPPEEDDDLVSLGGALGIGVMHGASMSQGNKWDPSHVTASIYRGMYPNVSDRAKVLFKDWVPPVRETAIASPTTNHAEMSMDAFMGGSSSSNNKSEVQASDMSSFMSGSKSTSTSNNNKASKNDEDDAPKEDKPNLLAHNPARRRGGRRYADEDEDEDEDDVPPPKNNKSNPSSSNNAKSNPFTSKKRGDDDDDEPAVPSFSKKSGGTSSSRRRRGKGSDDDDEELDGRRRR